MPNKMGNRIMQRRKELGMTQEELANRLGYKSKSSINKIELGINDIVQSKIVKFAKVLDTTPAYIMGWDEEAINAIADEHEASINEMLTEEARVIAANQKLWNEEVGEFNFSPEEMRKLMDYAKYLIHSRKKDD